jgi:hypothetical protein
VDCVEKAAASMRALVTWQKCVEVMSLYKAPDDAYVTAFAIPRENLDLAVKPRCGKTVAVGCQKSSGHRE